ncbi:sodium channel protein Nach-like [Vanessa tameamea]|uniref:Sodium channel protein Nach-like n=1 Tax=Vanessa tameamea TaxID=334116 RepID=A0ABM4AYS7_VANTA
MVNCSQNKRVTMKVKNNFLPSPKRLSRWNYCVKKFMEFCKRTDLHGFKYIAMEELTATERSVWGLAVFISVICAAFFVITAYRWYARNPIVTVIESTQGAIWDVPFPAVTICDLNMISRRAALAFSTNITLPENITSDFIFKTLKFAPLIHSSIYADSSQMRDLHKLQDVLDLNDMSIENLFRLLSPMSSCSNLIERCMWKNTLYRCEQIFQHIFTGVNLCCTFNYYAVDDPDNVIRSFRFPTPRRVASCGYQTALTTILKTDPTDYYSTSFASLGSLVFVDNAYNVPDLDSSVRMANPATEVMIAVLPERTYTTSGIKSFRAEERNCYYNDEIQLANFRYYSFHNCMALRKVQILMKTCNCVPFYFPQKDYGRICNFHDIECLEKVINPAWLNDNGENDNNHKNDDQNNLVNCMPECEHFDYPLEVALGRLSKHIPLSATAFFDNIVLENRSVVNVFFNDLVATRYRRDVYLNWQNILAAFGGLLSLMLGFTLISGFDFVLFFSFKVIYDSISRLFIGDEHYNSSFTGHKGFILNIEEHKTDNWVKKAKKTKFHEVMEKKNQLERYTNRY